jgi:hypothetical protein
MLCITMRCSQRRQEETPPRVYVVGRGQANRQTAIRTSIRTSIKSASGQQSGQQSGQKSGQQSGQKSGQHQVSIRSAIRSAIKTARRISVGTRLRLWLWPSYPGFPHQVLKVRFLPALVGIHNSTLTEWLPLSHFSQ